MNRIAIVAVLALAGCSAEVQATPTGICCAYVGEIVTEPLALLSPKDRMRGIHRSHDRRSEAMRARGQCAIPQCACQRFESLAIRLGQSQLHAVGLPSSCCHERQCCAEAGHRQESVSRSPHISSQRPERAIRNTQLFAALLAGRERTGVVVAGSLLLERSLLGVE